MKSTFLNKLTILLAGFLLTLSGCKKFLDQQPITEVDTKAVFKDVSTTLQALAGVYNRLAGDNAYGLRVALHYPVGEDIFMGPSGGGDDRRGMGQYTLTALNSELPNPFNQMFEGISLANLCIDEIPKMDLYNSGSDKEKAQLRRMYGEALALRAQFYYDAIRVWGDLPEHFIPSYIQATTEPFPVRVDRETLYERILEDLKTAILLVPWRNEVTTIGDPIDERLTKGSLKGLRARIALARGGYSLRQNGSITRPGNYLDYVQIARDETNDIITSGQHSLSPDYKALWRDIVCAKQVVDPNGELMFQVGAIGGNSAADSKLGYANGPRVNGLGNSFINPLPEYLYLFDSTDLRRDVTIAPYNVAVDGITKIGLKITDMRDGKYRRDWIKPAISPTNQVQYFSLKWQMMRYSDILLMFAEAENELNGPTAAAYNAINMVRRRGFGKPISTPDLTVDIPAGQSKTEFFKYIVREKALEFGGEGIRKYDMIRWNLLATGIAEAKANLVKMAARTGTITYSYMIGGPVYASNIPSLASKMYFKNTATTDDKTIWFNSFYFPEPTSTPAGTTSANWVQAVIATDINNSSTRYANGFTTGKSELFPIPNAAREANPNLTQNPGY